MLGISKSTLQKGLLVSFPAILGLAFIGGSILSQSTTPVKEPLKVMGTTATKKYLPSPTRTSTPTPKPNVAVVKAVSTPTPTPDPDPTVSCGVHANCGGGTVSMKSSECSNSVCCEIGDKWYFYPSKDKCTQDQKSYYNSDDSYTYTPTYPPTSTPYPTFTPTPTPDRTEDILTCKNRALDIYQSDQKNCRSIARANGIASSSWTQECIQNALDDYEYRAYLCEH